ncbi:unnamed protein product [Closterium sp. NIES-54]
MLPSCAAVLCCRPVLPSCAAVLCCRHVLPSCAAVLGRRPLLPSNNPPIPLSPTRVASPTPTGVSLRAEPAVSQRHHLRSTRPGPQHGAAQQQLLSSIVLPSPPCPWPPPFPPPYLPEAAWMYEAEQRNSAGQALVWEYEVEARAEDLLARFRGMAHAAGITCHAVSRKAGDARAELCEAVERQAIELLVVGSRGLGAISRAMLGSVSDYLIHNASCPVRRNGWPAPRVVSGDVAGQVLATRVLPPSAEAPLLPLVSPHRGDVPPPAPAAQSAPSEGTHSEGAGVAQPEAEHGGRGEPRYKVRPAIR